MYLNIKMNKYNNLFNIKYIDIALYSIYSYTYIPIKY